MKIIKLKQKNKNGFTLVETLVGISILVVAITATFTAAQSGLSSSIESKDQVIAYFLAQEAVEAVRNLRDDNALASRHWLSGFSEQGSDPCYFGKACVYDGQLRTFTACPSGPGSCANLKQNNDSQSSTYGMYAYGDSTWSNTNFRREIEVANVGVLNNEIMLTVTMYWSKGIFTRSFVVNESLSDWQ